MSISRRDALLGATAAAVVTGLTTAPLAMKAAGVKTALAGDPVIDLARQLNAVWKAWMSAQDVYEEAAHRVGLTTFEAQEVSRELGIEPLWQEEQRLKAQFWGLQARLLDMPATTPRGVLAKLRGFYHDGEIALMRAGDDPDNDLPVEFAASIYRDLERLAKEARTNEGQAPVMRHRRAARRYCSG